MSDYASPADAGSAGAAGSASATAGELRRPVEFSTPRRPGLVEHIIRRWWVIALGIGVGLVVALVYLFAATPLYTTTTILSLDHPISPGGNVKADEFFKAQRELIVSEPVLLSAIDSLDMSQRARMVGYAHSVNALRDAMVVRTSLSEQVISISLQSPDSMAGAKVLNAITNAYFKARGDAGGAAGNLAELTKASDARATERAAAEKALADFRASANLIGSDADHHAADQLKQLTTALAAAQSDVDDATAAIASCKELAQDPIKRDEMIEANRSKGIFGGLDQQRKQVETQLATLEPQLERQKQTMSPQHPALQAAIMKVENLKQQRDAMDKEYVEAYRSFEQQQQADAQKRINDLKTLIATKSQQGESTAVNAGKLAELEANFKKADAALAEADAKLNQIKIGADDSGPHVQVALAATPSSRATHPDWIYCLSSALIVGTAGGLALAGMGRSRR